MTLDSLLGERIHCFIKKSRNLEQGDLYDTVMALVERPLITSALEESGYNQVKAAELLGINRNTIRKKIKELGIPVKR
jgi:two-component system nitrogen regulation response regulator GlnG